jgi:hypothetical protein
MNNNIIRKVTYGAISTMAGTGGVPGFTRDGGPAVDAELNSSSSVFVDKTGRVFIADTSNQVIRMVNTVGIITTMAGSGYLATAETMGRLSLPRYTFQREFLLIRLVEFL